MECRREFYEPVDKTKSHHCDESRSVCLRRQGPVVCSRCFVTLLQPACSFAPGGGHLAAFLGQVADTSIIVVMVFVGVALNFVQTYRSQSAIKALQKRVRATASVLRNGSRQEIAREQVNSASGGVITVVRTVRRSSHQERLPGAPLTMNPLNSGTQMRKNLLLR